MTALSRAVKVCIQVVEGEEGGADIDAVAGDSAGMDEGEDVVDLEKAEVHDGDDFGKKGPVAQAVIDFDGPVVVVGNMVKQPEVQLLENQHRSTLEARLALNHWIRVAKKLHWVD